MWLRVCGQAAGMERHADMTASDTTLTTLVACVSTASSGSTTSYRVQRAGCRPVIDVSLISRRTVYQAMQPIGHFACERLILPTCQSPRLESESSEPTASSTGPIAASSDLPEHVRSSLGKVADLAGQPSSVTSSQIRPRCGHRVSGRQQQKRPSFPLDGQAVSFQRYGVLRVDPLQRPAKPMYHGTLGHNGFLWLLISCCILRVTPVGIPRLTG